MFLRLPLRPLAARAYRRLRAAARGDAAESCFDVRDVRRVNDILVGHGHAPLTTDPAAAADGVFGAARFLLATAAARRLSLADPRLAFLPGLSETGKANVRDALAANLGNRVRRVYEFREDLRQAFPLALTPAGRGQYLDWLVSFGVADFGHAPEAAVWFLFELDADPARGLAASFRLHPDWQAAVPHGVTRFGWDELKAWVARRYGLANARWLRTAKLPPQMPAWDELKLLRAARPDLDRTFDERDVMRWVRDTPEVWRHADRAWRRKLAGELADGCATRIGVNVIGLFRYTSGLQQAVRSTVDSLDRCGVATALRDFPVLFLREPRDAQEYNALEVHDVTILNTGIDVPAADAYRKSGLHPRPGVRRVGLWWWELETVPARWLDRGAGVDEIWAPTTFIADAMRAAFAKPVFPMLPGITLPAFDPLPKGYFGFDPARFQFVFVFDMNSRMQRKNPLGLIRAFRRAFHPGEPVDLVLKVSPPESFYRDQWDELRAAAADAGAILIDRVLTRGELLGLLNACDAYASLHRSEGFGLTCAEAMLLGKPVVATGYSGNLDFMTAANSYLVRYDRVTLAEDIDPYPRGSVWADPDEVHAAEQMRRVYDWPDEARAKAAVGQREAAVVLSPAAAGRRMAERLDAIRRAGSDSV